MVPACGSLATAHSSLSFWKLLSNANHYYLPLATTSFGDETHGVERGPQPFRANVTLGRLVSMIVSAVASVSVGQLLTILVGLTVAHFDRPVQAGTTVRGRRW